MLRGPHQTTGWALSFHPVEASRNLQRQCFSAPSSLSRKLYQLSPIEGLELAKTLIRPSSLFREDLSKAKNFSNEGYGSVQLVYVVCDEDLGIPLEFQRWMIENGGIKDVMEIKGADHMAMFSKPLELCHRLLEIVRKYA